jgi:TonB-linked SusC/RagA family outer membrane protein
MRTLIFTSKKFGKEIPTRLCIFLLLLACYSTSFANDPINKNRTTNSYAFTVKGKVVDDAGKGLAGATVSEKGTTNSTATGGDGSFTINVQGQSAVLVVSYVGYTIKEVSVSSATSDLSIALSAVGSSLEDVIVVGYGTQRKQNTTSAISTVKGSELSKVPAANISNTLAGRATGVITRANGGRPGADNATITIRGAATTGASAPLIVVDNVIRNNINEIDPNNIETVSILKDAAAVAPFGLAGANGVILITTKRGTVGAPTLSFGGYYGDQQPTYLPKMLSAQDYMRLKNEAVLNDNPKNTSGPYPQNDIDNWATISAADPDDGKAISNALNDIVRKHSPIYQGTFQVRGGTQTIRYFAGFGYFKQEGMFNTANYDRYNYNVNLDVNVTPTTLATLSIIGTFQKTNDVDGGTGNLFRGIYKFLPISPLQFSNGLPAESSGNSPLAALASTGYQRRNTTNTLSTITVEQKLPFIKGLSVKGSVSYDPYNWVEKQWHKPFIYYTRTGTAAPYTFTPNASTQETSVTTFAWLQQQYWQQNTLTLQGYLNYHNTFGKHEITGLAVAEKRSWKQFDFRGRKNNFALDVDELNMGSVVASDVSAAGGSGTGATIGYVGRVNYAFDKRYLFEASGRYDGHYFFAPGKRMTFLPALSAGWVISNEKFFEPVAFVDNLKLRASWGKVGNLPTGGAFQFLSAYTIRTTPAYSFGDGTLVQGSFVNQESNPNITWEIGKKTDVGLEGSLWNNLLRFEAGYFYERRTRILLAPNIVVPVEYGLGLAQENAGVMENRGVELTLGTTKRLRNGLMVSVDANITYAKNKLINTFENAVTRNDPRRSRTGRRNGVVFGYEYLGLFTTADDKDGNDTINAKDGYTITQFGTLRPGDAKYADLGGPNGVPDGKIDSYDEKVIGNPQTPALIYGLNIGASWKGFDLSALLQGSGMSSFNTYGFMTVAHFNNNSNSAYEYYNNRWTRDNQDSKYPRAYSSPKDNNGQTSTLWVKNSSYLRLRTASLGYTIPAQISSRLRMKAVRVYVTGQNLVTFSKIKFTDPETNGEQGYPIQKTILAGFNITF